MDHSGKGWRTNRTDNNLNRAHRTIYTVVKLPDNECETHADQELAHADRLATRIQQLGGVPICDLQELAGKAAAIGIHPEQGTALTDMVIENLLLERRQKEAYTALIRD